MFLSSTNRLVSQEKHMKNKMIILSLLFLIYAFVLVLVQGKWMYSTISKSKQLSFVRMREQPEAVGPSEERAIQGVAKKTLEGKQPTEGLTNKQMKESNKQHSKV